MTLTIKDLEEAIIALRYAADGGVFVTGDRLFVEAVKPLEAEIRRHEQGPYSLSEAIASGRPFRRKVWAHPAHMRNEWYVLSETEFDVVFAGHFSGIRYAMSKESIAACDYELMPEGGEQ